MKPRRLALALVLLLAAGLRFTGLRFEVRHPQHYDDRVFLNNVIEMLAAGDLDHRNYEYPGLFFYLLAPPIAATSPERIDDPDALLAARATVAAFGVLSVWLLYRVGSRLAGPAVGLGAALLLAVSPHEVRLAHMPRPDVPLQAACLLAYLPLLTLDRRLRGDVRAGLAIGIATAVKFNGFLLFPSYVLARLLAGPSRLGRAVLVGVLAALTVLFFTPYAVLSSATYLRGVAHQMGAHYQEPMTLARYLDQVATYLGWIRQSLGTPGALLALVGAVLALRRDAVRWAPLLLHSVVCVLIMSSAEIIAPRFLIPASGPLFLAAALAVKTVSRGRRAAATVIAMGLALFPARASTGLVASWLEPSPRDEALDWIVTHLPSGARILETRAEAVPELRAQTLGVDPRRYELLFRTIADGGLRLLAPHMDLVIAGPQGGPRWAGDLVSVFVGRRHGRPELQLLVPQPGARPRYAPVSLDRARLRVSRAGDTAAALTDDDRATAWTTPGPIEIGDAIEVELEAAVPLARITLWLANRPARQPELSVFTAGDRGPLEERRVVPGREPVPAQIAAGRPVSQELLLQPRPVRVVRIVSTDQHVDPWSVAELELAVREEDVFSRP